LKATVIDVSAAVKLDRGTLATHRSCLSDKLNVIGIAGRASDVL